METTLLVALIAAIFSAAAATIAGLLAYSVRQRDSEIDRRFNEQKETDRRSSLDLEQEVKNASNRLHEQEKMQIRLEGELKLHERQQSATEEKLDQMSERMVTRDEMDQMLSVMTRLEKKLDALWQAKYRYPSPVSLPRVEQPVITPVPPRPERR